MITVDKRELQEMIAHRNISSLDELSTLIEVPLSADTLAAGDFAFLDVHNEPVGIERSGISNLLQKLRSGELERQLAKCDAYYSTVILLVEGVYDHIGGYLSHYRKSAEGCVYFRTRVEPNTRYTDIKALEVRLSELGIEIISAPNFDCSIKTIKTIYLQRTKPEEEHWLFKRIRPVKIPVKLSANPAVPMLLALCNRLGEKVAIRLINKYNTIWDIIHTSDEELLSVEGMGKGLLRNLRKGLGKPDGL